MKLPLIDKRNYRKVLRELDLSAFPTLPDFLIEYRRKLIKKEPVEYIDDARAYAKFKKYLEDTEKEINKYVLSKIDWDVISERPPRDFQKDGIKFLILNNRCILADDMGLGKSLQSVLASKFLPDEYNILVITLKTLKYNFANEIAFYDDRVSVIEKEWTPNKYTIVHFDSLKKWKKELIDSRFEVIIIDECHKFRNAKTQRMQIFDDILDETKKDIKKIWLLTGTPIDGKPLDYFNLLKLIKHPLSKNWREYVINFCNGYIDRWGRWNTSGHSNLERLHTETKGIILRRLKSDVAKDLPNKERKPLWLHLENTKGYNAVVDNYIKKKIDLLEPEELELVKGDAKVSDMVKLILRRQFLALEKVKDGSLIEVINNELEKDNKVLVFTNFTKVVDSVYDSFKSDSLFIDGRIDAKERIDIVERFNRDASIRALILNLKAGSVGLNAQGANSIIINDMDWVPSTMLQAEDRAYRIGQLRDVLAQYLLYKDTVDEILYETISRKMQIVSTVLEGKESQYFAEYEKSSELSKDSILKEIFAQLDRF